MRAYVSIGSNVDRERHIRAALAALRAQFGPIEASSVYETPAEGFAGEPFLNLVAAFDCELGPNELAVWLKQVEFENGRVRSERRFAPRTLDLDLILYGDLVVASGMVRLPHRDIRAYAFVLEPLLELAPDLVLPDTGEPAHALWRENLASGQMRAGRRFEFAAEMPDVDEACIAAAGPGGVSGVSEA
ncbi:MAG: 2-amino-4-hydroxy-6-hydroxymethyldihydropteridine diphosphokinase [Thiotrichales bacterium]